MFNRAIEFLKESKNELSKVVFPSRKETISATIVVILSVIFVSVFLGVVDLGLSKLMSMLVLG
jgi:preprotein translocase subunit SecE